MKAEPTISKTSHQREGDMSNKQLIRDLRSIERRLIEQDALIEKLTTERDEARSTNAKLSGTRDRLQEKLDEALDALDVARSAEADLQSQLEGTNTLAEGYYDEARKGWTKFRDAERRLERISEIAKHVDCFSDSATAMDEIDCLARGIEPDTHSEDRLPKKEKTRLELINELRLEYIQAALDVFYTVDNRSMAADGPVTSTRLAMTDAELKKIYNHLKAAEGAPICRLSRSTDG